MAENQVGVRAIFDTSKFDAGESRYIASLDTTVAVAESSSSRITSAFNRINPAVADMQAPLSGAKKGLDSISVSAYGARQAIYGAADAVEVFGGPNLTPAIRNIEGIGEMLGAIGSVGAVGVGAVALGAAIGLGVVEVMKQSGIVSRDTQGVDTTAKQLGAMAYSQVQLAVNYVTSMGDMKKATDASNKAFVDASVSLGIMSDKTKKLISEAQGWSAATNKASYIDLTSSAEAYARAKAKEREQSEKTSSIIEKYRKQSTEATQDALAADIKAEDEYYASREEAMQKYGLSVERMEDAHQRAMFQKQAQYAMSMSDAIGSRDAIAASRIQRQYDLDRSNAETEHAARVRQQSEDAANELEAMSEKFAQAQAVRDENNRAEIDKLAASKREELSIFQASLDAEKAARLQYSADIAAFWAQQSKNFPTTQKIPDFNVPFTATGAAAPGAAATGTTFSAASTAGTNASLGTIAQSYGVQIASALFSSIVESSKQTGNGTLGSQIRALFDESVLNVLSAVFKDAAR